MNLIELRHLIAFTREARKHFKETSVAIIFPRDQTNRKDANLPAWFDSKCIYQQPIEPDDFPSTRELTPTTGHGSAHIAQRRLSLRIGA